MSTERERVGRALQRKRRGVEMSQEELATKMRAAGATHWRQTTVSRVENGSQGVTVDELRLLSEILGGSLLGLVVKPAMRQGDMARRLDELEGQAANLLDAIRSLQADLDDPGDTPTTSPRE